MNIQPNEVERMVYADNDLYKAELETARGFLFVHLSVKQWSKTCLKAMRLDLDHLLDQARINGHEYLFMYNNIGFKFANLVKPLDIEEYKDGWYVGAWKWESE